MHRIEPTECQRIRILWQPGQRHASSFHNVCMMTRVLHTLRAEGIPMEADTLAALSPYIRSHINRFGQYTLDLSRPPAAINYDLPILGGTDVIDQPETVAGA